LENQKKNFFWEELTNLDRFIADSIAGTEIERFLNDMSRGRTTKQSSVHLFFL
jgi:hypothetical protein